MRAGYKTAVNLDWNHASAAAHFVLDPTVSYLNHGSFGACPQEVLAAQAELTMRIEREPVRFFLHEMESLFDAARAAVAELVGADCEDLVLLRNATTAVNCILGSLRLGPEDELLYTDHGYNACNNALLRAAEKTGATVVRAHIPFPISSEDELVQAILDAVSPRTRLALLDHVTSPTGLLLPIARLVAALAERGVDTLIDGAHGPGMVELNLRALGAAYYTGNLHKWCCLPKGAAFLFVRRDRQAGVHHVVTSHGKNSPRRDRSRFMLEFDWAGSDDYTAMLVAPKALAFMGSLLPGGWSELFAENRKKALTARRVLADALGIPLPCPDSMIGALAALPLPPSAGDLAMRRPGLDHIDPLQDVLYDRHRIEVPVIPWPEPPARLIRISAQIYNHDSEYTRLAAILKKELRTS